MRADMSDSAAAEYNGGYETPADRGSGVDFDVAVLSSSSNARILRNAVIMAISISSCAPLDAPMSAPESFTAYIGGVGLPAGDAGNGAPRK